MSNLGDLLEEALDQEALTRIGQRVGADPVATRRGVAASAAVLTEALRNNARRKGGDRALFEALRRDHDGSVLERRDDVFAGRRESEGQGILRHVLGENQDAAAGAIGQFAGLDKGKALQLLIMLAPLIMGVLGKMRTQKQVESPHGLPEILRGPKPTERPAPSEDGGLGGIPDPGGVLGDILKGRGTGQSPGGSGEGAGAPGCMSLLGPLLGGRR